jgi:hypothetical protein
VRCLHEREWRAVIDAILVKDERAPGNGMHLGICGDDAERDRVERDDCRQVVKLGGENIPGARPVAERRLGQQELK